MKKYGYPLGFITLSLMVLLAVGLQSSVGAPSPIFQYLSPRPEARLVSPETTIAFRPSPASIAETGARLFSAVSVRAVGSQSGLHTGEMILALDGETIIFAPDQPFAAEERVEVWIGAAEGVERPFSHTYSFNTAPPRPDVVKDDELWPGISSNSYQPKAPETADPLPAYRTTPSDFPALDVFSAPGAEDGYIFLAHYSYSNVSRGKAYLFMLDENGEPVYYNRLDPLKAALDFKKQPNGLLTYADAAQKKFIVMDQTYTIIDSYEAGNGYVTDLHDFQMLDNGNALIFGQDYQLVDMSAIVPGGNPAAVVVGCILQEQDSQGNVLFEWRSWDHIPITDSNQDLTADKIWYIHCNSIEQDWDGHLLISSRNLDEVTKINRQTGEVIWRLGGKGNQFTFTNDVGFFFQHDARRLPNGRLSIYDNRANQLPRYSRGVEYLLDEINLNATKVYEFRNTPDSSGGAMGNYQRLPGGNVLVGWGWNDEPVLTEALADGTKVFELNAGFNFGTYRAFKFLWQGFPTWPPKLVGYSEDRTVSLYFSYNGATEVVGYRIYGDKNNPPTTILGGPLRTGFETTFTYEAPSDELYYFRVMPVLANGVETQYSDSLPVFVNGLSVYLPIMVKN